jgi:putative ABC transport system permease protein
LIINLSIISLVKDIKKEAIFFIIFVLIISIICSVFFINDSIKYRLKNSIENQPDITLQNIKSGFRTTIDETVLDNLSDLVSIKNLHSRVYGQYYFTFANRYLTIMGIDIFSDNLKPDIQNILQSTNLENLDEDFMIISKNTKDLFSKYYYKDSFKFMTLNDEVNLKIKYIFDKTIDFETDNLIIMSIENAKRILSMEEYKVTDIVFDVPNKLEIPIVIDKIKKMYPTLNILYKDDYLSKVDSIYDYKSGIFIVIYLSVLFTFFLILYFRISDFSGNEIKKISILRAVGWSIIDIIKYRLYSALLFSIFGFIIAILLSYIYVFIFNAPLLSSIFFSDENFSSTFSLYPVVDFFSISIIFLISIPLYILSVIIPSWKIAVSDFNSNLK